MYGILESKYILTLEGVNDIENIHLLLGNGFTNLVSEGNSKLYIEV